ncbi:LexA family protein [Prosthecobacter vanneervenii]|uniref:Repressor LexA n=1 Tax=Prosthecobacter vanneervenii TaxID=48466 RepID=A0A7W7YBR3_9BACT|nr:S24 family peptidase [Prosthecobacter vanneervenii]MBB5033189.1 repressor LexA [Prosthecobacter vanneervenii]
MKFLPNLQVLAVLWHADTHPWIRQQVPLLGSIIAGSPEVQEGRIDTCVDIDPSTFSLPGNARTFALKVRGDSMRNAAILEGDIVIMEFREPKHGNVVAALIDGETTLKRYVLKDGVPYLRAANPKYPDLIPARELVIQGVMVGLLRLPK